MARGDGRIFRKPGTRFWWAEYWLHGRRIRTSTKQEEEQHARLFLQTRVAEGRLGEWTPPGKAITLHELLEQVAQDYEVHQRRSRKNLRYPFAHLERWLGAETPATAISTALLSRYIQHRRSRGAAESSIRGELHYLERGYKLAVRARRYSERQIPYVPKLSPDPSRVRQGWLSREDVERVAVALGDDVTADLVRFLFWSAWRVGEARSLEWRDYDPAGMALRLRTEVSKTKQPRLLPVVGEIAAVIGRRLAARDPLSPRIFHRRGKPIGDFRKRWATALEKAELPHRMVHDLRRSAIKHLVESGVDQRRAMAFSGHRTTSVFHRYQISDLESLRQAALMAAEKRAPARSSPAEISSPAKTDSKVD